MFKKIGITTKRNVENKQLFIDLIQLLIDRGHEVLLSSHARNNVNGSFKKLADINYNKEFDLLIAYGGDGTILRAVRNIKHFSTSILGINGGHLGFLAAISEEDWRTELEKILDGDFLRVYKTVCKVKHFRKGKETFKVNVLNDAVISFKDVARLITVKAEVDKNPLCNYKADGLIISTPTGSTAYNLAAGGPIVYPSIRAAILTPICSHSFTQKPIVIPGEKIIKLSFLENDAHLNLTLDGQKTFTIEPEDYLTITMKRERVQFLKNANDNFFQTLRDKLHWGETLR